MEQKRIESTQKKREENRKKIYKYTNHTFDHHQVYKIDVTEEKNRSEKMMRISEKDKDQTKRFISHTQSSHFEFCAAFSEFL